jgi:hypothetical protein
VEGESAHVPRLKHPPLRGGEGAVVGMRRLEDVECLAPKATQRPHVNRPGLIGGSESIDHLQRRGKHVVWVRTVLVGQCQPRLNTVSAPTAPTIQVAR